MHRFATTLLLTALVVSACVSAAPPDLREAAGDLPGEVDAALTDLRDILDQPYESLPQLYQRIEDTRLPTTIAILFDRAGRIEAPGHEPEIARYEAFVGEVLLATEGLDAGVADQDLEEILIAWLRIEAAAGALAVALPAEACSALIPTMASDLCLTQGTDGYEAALEEIVKRFLGRYRPALRLPEVFGETITARTLARLSGEIVQIVEVAAEEIIVLQPTTAHEGVHIAFVEHLADLATIWSEVDPFLTDPLLPRRLGDRLTEAACEAEDEFLVGRALLLTSVPESVVPELGALWLQSEPTGCR